MKSGPYSFETSSLDKVLFPVSGNTKGDLIDYPTGVSEYILPHIKDRLLLASVIPNCKSSF